MKYRILKIIFIIWVALWLSFVIRELFKKGYFYDYKILMARSADGKRAYVTTDRFYEFLIFCKNNMLEGATYKLMGPKDFSHDKRRAAYYLYPHLETENADFIIVYDSFSDKINGYERYTVLDKTRYILKRK